MADAREDEGVAPSAGASRRRRRPRRTRTLRNVLEDRRRRHVFDAVQLAIALVGIAYFSLRYGQRTQLDTSVGSAVAAIPRGFDRVFDLLYFLGGLWIVVAVVVGLLLWRKFEAAAQVFVVGTLAWIVSGTVGWIASGTAAFRDATIRTTPDAPVTRVAVVVAVTLAMAPFVPRPLRRLGILLAAVVGMSSIYLGYREATAVVFGFFVGLAVCKVVQLARGTPEGLPSVADIDEAMEGLGVPITQVEQVAAPFGGALLLRADGEDGSAYLIEAAGRDARDTQVLVKMSRWLIYKDSGPRFSFNRLEQLEHHAYIQLLASSHKVRVPGVVTVGVAGPGTALLVTRDPEATPLAEVTDDICTDGVLDAAWSQVHRMHATHIAHGALTCQAVQRSDDGTLWITGFALASSAAPTDRIRRDQAEFLVSTALKVGSERALAAAQRALGNDGLTDILPLLQPSAMAAVTRRALRNRKHFLKDLIKEAVALTGSEEPQLEQLRRISPATLLMAGGTLIAVYALMVQIGNPQEMWNQVKNAQWVFVLFAGLATLSTNIAYGVALVGSVPAGRIKYGVTSLLELATSFANVAVPGGVGTSVFVVRYLQRMGLGVTTGVTAMVTTNIASGIVQITLFLVCLPFASKAFSLGKLPSDWPVFVIGGVLGVAAIVAVAFGVPALRNRIMPQLEKSKSYFVAFVRSPRQVLLNFVGNLGAALLSIACLGLCLRAFGGHTSFAALVVINIGSSTVSNMIPVPGGMGVGAIGRSAGLVAVGVPQEIAVPATLAQQLLSVWLPVLPGWFATRVLMRREYL